MKKTFALCFIFVLMFVSSLYGQDITNWEPVQDGNMIVTVRTIDKDGIHIVQYKYHIKSPPLKRSHCNEVQYNREQDEIWLMTQEPNPWLYIIESQFNAYKPQGQDTWIGVDEFGRDLR